LEVEEGWNKWHHTRTWLSIGKLTNEKMHRVFHSSNATAYPDPLEWDNEKRVRRIRLLNLLFAVHYLKGFFGK